jgi:hypothetical protein
MTMLHLLYVKPSSRNKGLTIGRKVNRPIGRNGQKTRHQLGSGGRARRRGKVSPEASALGILAVLGIILSNRIQGKQAQVTIRPKHPKGSGGPGPAGRVDDTAITKNIRIMGRDIIAPLNSGKRTRKKSATLCI